jgi:hypothetical protein
LRPNHDKTPYDIWFGRPKSVKHFRFFGSKCYIKNDEDNLGNFDPRSNEGIFLGYSPNKKAYIFYNIRLLKIVESANVKIDDLKLKKRISQDVSKIDKESQQEDDDKESQQEYDDKETQKMNPILMKKTMKKCPFQKLH